MIGQKEQHNFQILNISYSTDAIGLFILPFCKAQVPILEKDLPSLVTRQANHEVLPDIETEIPGGCLWARMLKEVPPSSEESYSANDGISFADKFRGFGRYPSLWRQKQQVDNGQYDHDCKREERGHWEILEIMKGQHRYWKKSQKHASGWLRQPWFQAA